MDIERFLHHEESKGDVYKLLSRCYYLPGGHTSTQAAELATALKSVYPEASELTVNMGDEIDVEQLKIDFSRLYVGPFKLLAPPYGSVYLEPGRRVMGDSTVDARNMYREAGLDFSDNLKEAPDHIAIELEFIYFLIFKEMEAIASSDGESALTYLITRKRFLIDHLGAWVSAFADKVEGNATTEFYKNLARVTKVVVQKDKAEIARVSFAEAAARQPAD